jgi:hypothetical protein
MENQSNILAGIYYQQKIKVLCANQMIPHSNAMRMPIVQEIMIINVPTTKHQLDQEPVLLSNMLVCQ